MGTIAQCIVNIEVCIRRARQTLAEGGAGASDPSGTADAALAGIEAALAELREAEEQLRTEGRNLLTTQRLLEKERRRYADLFDLAPDAYFVTDAEGVIHAFRTASADRGRRRARGGGRCCSRL